MAKLLKNILWTIIPVNNWLSIWIFFQDSNNLNFGIFCMDYTIFSGLVAMIKKIAENMFLFIRRSILKPAKIHADFTYYWRFFTQFIINGKIFRSFCCIFGMNSHCWNNCYFSRIASADNCQIAFIRLSIYRSCHNYALKLP